MAQVPVGITVPKLLPITGTFAPAFAAYYGFLSLRVVMARVNNEQFMGDHLAASSSAPRGDKEDHDPLLVASRCHSNFAENVPLALFLGAVCEMNGANRRVLTGSLAALLLLRVAHSELGLQGKGAMSVGRPIGYFGTLGVVLGFAGWAGYLVRGYWGL